jgi:uncharacterized protein
MIRVVIDTNVILSALYFPRGKPWSIMMLALEGNIRNIVSEFILEEVRHVLGNKFLWESAQIEKAVASLESFSELVFHDKYIDIIRYNPDNRILECALAGGADYIISGDHHLTDLAEYRGIIIINPSTFLSIIQPEEPLR